MSAAEAGRLASEAGVGRLVLTHISDELDLELRARTGPGGVRGIGGDGRRGRPYEV